MLFKKVNLEDFYRIRQFYWDLIDEMSDQNDKIGWKKGIYPTDSFLQESLDRGELFVLEEEGQLCASVILNSVCNEGYAGVPWNIECDVDEILSRQKDMFYEDTGWTEYKMYERVLQGIFDIK